MKNPLVSIIVPVYNSEKFLDKCIDSIINQTYKNLEIIFVNDGSTDNSGKILDNYTKIDSRIKVIHQANNGVSSARNNGIKISSGEWISFIDADDYIDQTMIEKLVAKSNNVDLVFCRSKCIYSDGREMIFYETNLDKVASTPYDLQYIIHDRIHEEKDNVFTTDCIRGVVWRHLFKSEIIKSNSLKFKVGIKILEDRLFMMNYLSLCKKASLVDEYLYHYVVNVGSATQQQKKYRPDLFNERKELLIDELQAINSAPLTKKEKFYLCAMQTAKLWWAITSHECFYNPNYKKQLSYYRKKGGIKNPITFKFLIYLKKQGYSLKRIGMFIFFKYKWWGLFKSYLPK